MHLYLISVANSRRLITQYTTIRLSLFDILTYSAVSTKFPPSFTWWTNVGYLQFVWNSFTTGCIAVALHWSTTSLNLRSFSHAFTENTRVQQVRRHFACRQHPLQHFLGAGFCSDVCPIIVGPLARQTAVANSQSTVHDRPGCGSADKTKPGFSLAVEGE